MDPVSMLLVAALKNPEMAASAVKAVNAPGVVDIARMQGSLVDLDLPLAPYQSGGSPV